MIYDEGTVEPLSISNKHSKMGVASFVISLIQGFITITTIVMAGVITTWGPQDEHETAFMIIGFIIFGGIFVHITGVGLGIAGICQRNSKKALSILGLIFNIGAVLVVMFIMGIGVIAAQAM